VTMTKEEKDCVVQRQRLEQAFAAAAGNLGRNGKANGKTDEPPPTAGYDGPEGYEERIWPGEGERPDKPDQTEFDALGVVWADDIQLELDKPGLVDGLLGTAAMTVLYGESGSGKTFVAVDIACHVAAGKPWRGMAVEQGTVVYVAAESPTSIKRRIWAWKRRHDVEHLPIAIVTASVNLLNGDTEKVIALIQRIREQTGRPVAFVVIDTLARAMVGNENSPEDMGAFVSSCDRIREASAGHVMVVHHSGKDQARGARGHSSLRAATDVEMEVAGGESVRSVTVKKNRDGEEGDVYGFKLDIVELGENAKGRMVTTCVVAEREADGEVTKVTNAACRGANQRVTYEALQAALSDHGAPPPPAHDIPSNVRVVTVTQWREAATRYLPHEETKHKAQAFKRAMERLVAERVVRHVDGYVWLPGPGGHKGHNGHILPDVTECDRTESSGHKGHTVTHPFRGVTDVTVTSDGQEQPSGEKAGLDETDRDAEPLDKPASRWPAGLGASMIRHLERQARDTVQVNKPATVFWFSPLVGLRGGVKAVKCKLVSFYDGPDSAYDDDSRGIQLSTEKREGRRAAHYAMGGRWPCWLVAVEGHAAPDNFPIEPQAFNEWFDRWAKKVGAKIICDYRKEAEADGGLDYMKPRDAEADQPEWSDL
jgi:hypothetical protein